MGELARPSALALLDWVPRWEPNLRKPWEPTQRAFVESGAKRIVIRAGRRGGKTVGVAIKAMRAFLAGRRVLYASPTQDQIDRFWYEVKRALSGALDAGAFYANETRHLLEVPGTENRIRAKTAWNADTLRGDYADLLILDEWQLMDEDAWEHVGAPMLLDNDGDAVFVYTPPSLHSRSVSKARDPRHAARLFAAAAADATGRWETYSFPSHHNPHISPEALAEIMADMTAQAYRQEILAEDLEDVPGALWTRALLEAGRIKPSLELRFARVVIGVDPPGGSTECGVVVAARGDDGQYYVLDDASLRASPDRWAEAVIEAYALYSADRVVGEANYGGDMVESTIREAARSRGIQVSYRAVQATRGKAVRAEPIAAMYEQGRVHHVGALQKLEDEMCSYVQGESARSPNRMDALVWALTELAVRTAPAVRFLP